MTFGRNVRRARPGLSIGAMILFATVLAFNAPSRAAEGSLDATATGDGLRAPVLPGPCVPSRATCGEIGRGGLIVAADPVDSKDARDRASVLLDDDSLTHDAPSAGLHGFDQFEAAYTLPSPGHWSKLKNRLEVGTQGEFSSSIKWKVNVRGDYDAVYDTHLYPPDVRKDQRFELAFRETFIDIGAGDFDFRLGRQQIIWGEVVGLFFADVVSAKDLRESVLPDFDLLRIPQWAARAEYYKGDTHLEAIWIPVPTVDAIGKPGSNFYGYPPVGPAGYGYFINAEMKPRHDWSNQNFGLRASTLFAGWDGSIFAYRSVDAEPTFLRQVVNGPTPAVTYTPVHEKVTQYGMTISKDLDDFIFKGEAVYSVGREFNVTRLTDTDGVVKQNYLDYILSFEFALPSDGRLNLQLFQRLFTDHDRDIVPKKVESGVSVFWSGKWGDKVEPSILAIHSLNRNDWLVRPKIVWNFKPNWRAAFGADVFGGHPSGLFGQYDKRDRVYAEIRRSF